MGWYDETPEGVVIAVSARPRSSRAGVEGLFGDSLKVRICAAPVDGKANRELAEVLADAFSLRRSDVVFKSGETSKTKRILLRGVAPAALRRFMV